MANKYLDNDGVLYLWNKVKALVTGAVPTKTSDLTNDSGFITSADVPEGASASTSTPYMDSGDGAVGTSTAFARGDHVHPSDSSKVDVTTYQSDAQTMMGLLSGKADTSDIPTDNLDLSNGAGYQTASDVQTAINSAITNMYKYKGSVATVSALPSSGNTTGDVYNVEATGMNYAWNGSAWDALGEIFTITAITNAELDTICT